MNKVTKILILVAILLFIISPLVTAERINTEQFFQLGSAEREYAYQGTTITCYLGQLFLGQPIYWCLYPDGSMDHSWFVYQQNEMRDYYVSGGPTGTLSGN